MTTTTSRTTPPSRVVLGQAAGGGRRGWTHPATRTARHVVVGASSLFWTALVVVPLYWIVITSLRDQADFFTTSPLTPPSDPTLDNYGLVWSSGFPTYLLNSVIVTVAAVALTLAAALMASYVVVRFNSRSSRWFFRLFLLGLAIPLQAVIIPVYLLIIELHLYDSLLAIVLPSAAFAIPVAVLVLVGFLRDVPRSLYEAMDIDGAGEWRILWSLVLPLTRPALTTVAVYSGLQVWNGFLFPLILTQNPDRAVLPLALTAFRGQFGINVPATMAAVVLSTLPVLALFMIGRRQLVAGLTAGFTK
ncbi:carbohydrate ABC transporter permease [Saccharothrix sp. S26]|uniref:carbohydrate ABC transporter permease n=1 Tax=Saccharothrix sp. S26 TaxID=2907215 RepID=UPI001F3F59D7|nr:carbohydrate ABC transporter permease [Saccharothrix sp. S26]MCE6995540.1 carbohydrate ABC transporter permease [Saccharothrix sp. S26]